MHAICPGEKADVNRFAGDVALNDTGNDNLDDLLLAVRMRWTFAVDSLTVGRATPYATRETRAPADPNAGEATPSPT